MLWKGIWKFEFELNIPVRPKSVSDSKRESLYTPMFAKKIKRHYSLRKVKNKRHTSFVSWNSYTHGSAYLEIFDTQESEILETIKKWHKVAYDPTTTLLLKYDQKSLDQGTVIDQHT